MPTGTLTNPALAQQLLDALDALVGLHPGFRPAHAKGPAWMTRYRSGGRSSSTPCPGSMASIHRAIPSPRCARTSTCSAAAGGGRSSATGGVDQRPDPQLAFTKGTKLMSIASPPRALTTVGVVTHPRRNCDEVFTAIVDWVRARGARLIGLPEEAPAGVSLQLLRMKRLTRTGASRRAGQRDKALQVLVLRTGCEKGAPVRPPLDRARSEPPRPDRISGTCRHRH